MEIKQLKAFVAVADAKSFLKAADGLFISRQAISKTIQKLEEELNTDLFVRDQTGATLTPAGIFLYPRATALIAECEKLKEDTMDANRSYRQLIRLYLSEGIFGYFAAGLMQYGDDNSSEVDLQTKTCLDADSETILAERKADAVLSFSPLSQHVALSEKLFDSPLMFLISNKSSLLKKQKLTTRDILSEPLLLYTGGQSRCIWWYDHPGAKDIICGDLSYIFTLLKENKGVLPIPEVAIPSFLDFAEEIPAPSLVESIPVYYSMLYPDHYTPLLQSKLVEIKDKIFSKRNGL